MRKWSSYNRWGEVQIKRFDRVYWLRERNGIWDLQKQIKEIRSNLFVLLEASSLYVAPLSTVQVATTIIGWQQTNENQVCVNTAVSRCPKSLRRNDEGV